MSFQNSLLTYLPFCFFFIYLFSSPKIGLCILASSTYHTRSRGPPPPPLPPSNLKSKGNVRMDDTSNIRKDNATHEENIETSDGRSTPAQNDLILWLEQKIMELQGELEQVHNLANLSLTLNVPDANQQNTKNLAPPQNTPNQHPQNPHQYATPHINPNPPPIPTPPQHQHHPIQYPQTTTYHTPQNTPQPTPDPQNSTNDHHYTQIPRVYQSNTIYVETLPYTPQQTLYIPESTEKDLFIKNMA